jgi:hypothetical protein
MEIIPPSFTGDPNSARCPEECFRLGMYGLNAALWYDKLGFRRIIDVGSRFKCATHPPCSFASCFIPFPFFY